MSFDQYALDYEKHLERGLALSGESSGYFVRERLRLLVKRFASDGFRPQRIVEFGCGTGNNLLEMRRLWPDAEIFGLDTSESSLERAEARLQGAARVTTPDRYRDEQPRPADWVFCNGVLHHIPADEQPAALDFLNDLLRPAGVLTIFENNPLNPGTHLVMRRIPFDHDAKMLSPFRLARQVQASGIERVDCSYLFVFPRVLSFLRWMEPLLAKVPIGAQYVVTGYRGSAALRER